MAQCSLSPLLYVSVYVYTYVRVCVYVYGTRIVSVCLISLVQCNTSKVRTRMQTRQQIDMDGML